MKRILTSFPRWMAMFTLAAFLFAATSPATAQNNDEGGEIEETIKQLTQRAAEGYLAPVVTPIGMDLNGGWFHKAPPAKLFGLSMELGLVGMATTVPDDVVRTFSVTDNTFQFSDEQAWDLVDALPIIDQNIRQSLFDQIKDQQFTVSIHGPNIMGAPDEEIQIDFSGADVTYPDPYNPGQFLTDTLGADTWALTGIGGLSFLEDLSVVPLAAPQLSVGTVFGTRATIRYIPTINLSSIPGASLFLDEDFGNISYFGFGLQHNPSVLLQIPLPVDVAVAFYTQTFKIGEDFLTAKTTAWGLNASKQLGIGPINITPYAGFMLEKSTIDIAYQYVIEGLGTPQEIDIDLHFEGENKSRLTLGLSVRLLLFNINADYNIGKYKSYTVGVMFAL